MHPLTRTLISSRQIAPQLSSTLARRSAVPQIQAQQRRTAVGAAQVGEEFVKERSAVESHAAHSADLWRKITFYVAFPLILIGSVLAKKAEDDHVAHHEHLVEENGGEELERIVYPYFNKRTKEFPWGNQSLFHNPHTNLSAPDE